MRYKSCFLFSSRGLRKLLYGWFTPRSYLESKIDRLEVFHETIMLVSKLKFLCTALLRKPKEEKYGRLAD
ncbi:protein HASTY 1-like [Pyrus ussuriensis x Pyrus communis]|uniref:Protein HASTY 1-like n=1 Tax=Pyrus ussuriensis x Pyrus communis TaxID=2448454 RepID=A0A5N5HX61_9ROSA|nr:protein HASTY 1-like [Pyrus ussuriensis x Pyrus communis]